MTSAIIEVKAFTWLCEECGVVSADITDDHAAVVTMARFHDQLHHREKR